MIKQIFFLLAVMFVSYSSLQSAIAQANEVIYLPHIIMETELGEIELEIYVDKAPLTSANFLRYVNEDRFEGASFYRVVTMQNQPYDSIRIEVIQGGLGWGEAPLRLPPIKHESTLKTGIKHTDGVISMARLEPGSANSEFFICIGEQPELDYGGMRNPDGHGFAAFGKVVRGMEVVKEIQNKKEEGQILLEPIEIMKVYRLVSE